MTFSLFGYRVTIFKLEKLEKFTASIDTAGARRDADQIKNSAQFADLKAKAAAIRAARG